MDLPTSEDGNKRLVVVKLGGSHAASRHLAPWLDVLAGCGGQVILVPGGGPFADAVRVAQGHMRFDDVAAHHMALLAMEQFGRALAGLRPGFRLAGSRAAIRQVLGGGGVPIWSPSEMVPEATGVPASWDVTSDSLAAWLAGHMGVERLLLVKQGDMPDGPVPAVDLAARGIVDPAFPVFLAASGARASVAVSSAWTAAAAALRSNRMPGIRID